MGLEAMSEPFISTGPCARDGDGLLNVAIRLNTVEGLQYSEKYRYMLSRGTPVAVLRLEPK